MLLKTVISIVQDKRIEHAQTKARLKEVSEKLETAFDEMENLKHQLEQEKRAFKMVSVHEIRDEGSTANPPRY